MEPDSRRAFRRPQQSPGVPHDFAACGFPNRTGAPYHKPGASRAPLSAPHTTNSPYLPLL
eukprot:3381028-Amphidinium_carterae.1